MLMESLYLIHSLQVCVFCNLRKHKSIKTKKRSCYKNNKIWVNIGTGDFQRVNALKSCEGRLKISATIYHGMIQSATKKLLSGVYTYL